MSPFGVKTHTHFRLRTPLDGKGVPPFAIPVFIYEERELSSYIKMLPLDFILQGALN